MNAEEIITALGGAQAVQRLTGLSKGRISQWKSENHIPRAWLRVLLSHRPDVFEIRIRRKGTPRTAKVRSDQPERK